MKRAVQFTLCLDDEGNEASLIRGKVYAMVPDEGAARDDLVRVIDESGEDYLFAKSQFVAVAHRPFVGSCWPSRRPGSPPFI